MRLATTQSDSKDGQLLVLGSDAAPSGTIAQAIAPNLITALERWPQVENALQALSRQSHVTSVDLTKCKAPLPRCYGFLDGSAYLSHVKRVRKSRGAEMPPEFEKIPLMYQGISDHFLDPVAPLLIQDEEFGVDFEAELAVIVDDVPMGVSPKDALKHIKLLILLNDTSLRNLIPAELARGFGFLQGKPASSCAPFALTPDELGSAWVDGRAHLQIRVTLNGKLVGDLDSREMSFSFPELISHAARTRRLSAGTIIGSGTVSNDDESRGIGCLVEQRVLEIIKTGKASTPFLKVSDTFRIEAFLGQRSVFGAIEHTCVKA